MKRYLATFANKKAVGQVVKMGLIGLGNTLFYFAVFNVLRVLGVELRPANVIAFTIGTALAYVLNRKWTFDADEATGSLKETAKFFGVNVVALMITDQMIAFADRRFELTRIGENLVLVVAAAIILLPKFAAYRDLVFGSDLNNNSDNLDTEAVS
ncbi:GtrA-like protein [bacterium BMS3Bbin02]|nr:GtrA-like protein [bacterium BMS3Bbin02]